MKIIIKIDKYRRIAINSQSGLDIEAYVDGIGWVLDNEADIPDHVISGYIKQAKSILGTVSI
jgi:hypothetical protein